MVGMFDRLSMTGAARAGLVLHDRKVFVTYITAPLGNNPYFVLLSERFAFAGEGRASRSIPTAPLGSHEEKKLLRLHHGQPLGNSIHRCHRQLA